MGNRYVRSYLIAGIIVLLFIFVAPLFFYSGPEEDRIETYYRTVTFLIPIAIAVFILPTATYKLKEWDIHFNFITDKDTSKLQITVSNFGETPFNFNRIAFVSYRRFFFFGKRIPWPSRGIFDKDVELHGAETQTQMLHEHIGYTVRLGMPIVIWIRPGKLSDYLKRYCRPKIMIYFEGTDQCAYSKRIPKSLLNKFISNSIERD